MQPRIPLSAVPNVKPERNWLNCKELTPQAKTVLDHLKISGSITSVEAHMVLKVRSVSRRITELIDAGYRIKKQSKTDSTGQRYTRYTLQVEK